VKHGEALVLDALGAVLQDVALDEVEIGLVGRDGVGEVVLVDILFGVTDERSNGLNAGRTLEVLRLLLLEESVGDASVVFDADFLKEALEDLVETLQVPVLVNAGVDDERVEHLLHFVRK